MSVEHAPWCAATWAPHVTIGSYKRGPKEGQGRTERRSSQCTCGASDSAFKRLLRRVREMVS